MYDYYMVEILAEDSNGKTSWRRLLTRQIAEFIDLLHIGRQAADPGEAGGPLRIEIVNYGEAGAREIVTEQGVLQLPPLDKVPAAPPSARAPTRRPQ